MNQVPHTNRIGSRGNGEVSGGSRRITVCHLSYTLDTGGLERLLADFARFCDRSRFRLTFVAMHRLGRFADEIRHQYWPVSQLTSRKRLPRVRELVRFFRRWNVDVLHTHNTYPHIYGTVAARLAGVPVVVSTRHGQRFGQNGRSRAAYRWASRFVDRIVAVSNDDAELCIQADGIPRDKVLRIWKGIDVEAFSQAAAGAPRRPTPVRGQETRAQLGPVAVSVARLSAEKDFPTLLRAAQSVAQQIPEFQLRIVGDGPERSRLRRLCAELELNGHVQFLGERTDVPQLLAQPGLFVSSSLTEGLSLTLLEAMAAGLPVIATHVGGNAEVVEEGITGRLVPPNDPQALAQAVIDLCRSPNRCIEMGRRARQHVTQHFDVRRMVDEYETLYSQLLNAAPSPADLSLSDASALRSADA